MADGIRVDGGLVSHTRTIARSRPQAADGKSPSASPKRQSSDAEGRTPSARSKSRSETRRRRGIRPKTDLAGKLRTDSAGRTQSKLKPKRRAPGPKPNKPPQVRNPAVPSPALAPETHAAPSQTAPTREPFSAGWGGWVRKQRRLLTAAAVGFMAGLLVYGLLGPEETPAPQQAVNAGKGHSPERDTGQARYSAEGASRRGTARTGRRADSVPAAGYGAPPSLGGSYAPRPNSASQAYGTYSASGYAPSLGNEQYSPDDYRPIVPDTPYVEEQWPSSTGRSGQRTFKQPLGGVQRSAERPWGNVADRRQQSVPSPQVPAPGYPPVVDPYAPLPDYPGPSAGPPADEWAPGSYYQSVQPPPYR